MPAVIRQARKTQVAAAAHDVDLADDALVDKVFVGARNDFANKFVARNAFEGHVALGDLKVGRADAGLAHADDRVAVKRVGLGTARLVGKRLVEVEGTHRGSVTGFTLRSGSYFGGWAKR